MERFKGLIGIGLIILGLIFGVNTYQYQAVLPRPILQLGQMTELLHWLFG